MRPSASDECDFEKGRAEYGRLPSSFGTSTPLSTTHLLSPRQTRSLLLTPHPSPHYHLLSSINFHHVNLPTSPSFLYPGSYVSPKSTHNYKTFNLNVKLKRNGFSSVSTVAIKSPRSVSPMIAHRFIISEKMRLTKKYSHFYVPRFRTLCDRHVFIFITIFCSTVL